MRPGIRVVVAIITLSVPTTTTAEEFGGIEFPQGKSSFADSVDSYSLNDGTGVEPPYDNPERALGPPDEEYMALGNTPDGGNPGELIVSFDDNRLVDVEGDDLYIFETGPTAEPTEVAVSVDGDQWTDLGKIEGSTHGLDLAQREAGGKKYKFVRLRDVLDGKSSDSPYGGPDIDAVGAIGSERADDDDDGGGGHEKCSRQTGSSENYGGRTFPHGPVSFADQVAHYSPGGGVSDEYRDPTRALHEPDEEFMALGNAAEGEGTGTLVLYFQDNALYDGDGDDLYVFEEGPTTEATYVEISPDGVQWFELGRISGSTTTVDLSAFDELPADTFFHFVRLSDPGEEKSDPPYAGPDIDSVGAIQSCDVAMDTDSDSDGTPDASDKCPHDSSVDSVEPDHDGQSCSWPDAVEGESQEGTDDGSDNRAGRDNVGGRNNPASGCGCGNTDGSPNGGAAFIVAFLALAALRSRH